MKFNEFTETVRDGLEVLFEPDNMGGCGYQSCKK